MAYIANITDNMNKCDNYTTPLNAFQDLATFKQRHHTTIYDPFYNDGKAKEYLKTVFPDCDIIHEPKDAFSWLPDFDVIISNPPFSMKDKVLRWLMDNDKPFMLLLPVNHICNKGYKRLANFDKIQYIIPNGRYNFVEDSKKNSAWFNVIWYCYKCDLPNQVNFIFSSNTQ
jgi:hypothetical protein